MQSLQASNSSRVQEQLPFHPKDPVLPFLQQLGAACSEIDGQGQPQHMLHISLSLPPSIGPLETWQWLHPAGLFLVIFDVVPTRMCVDHNLWLPMLAVLPWARKQLCKDHAC